MDGKAELKTLGWFLAIFAGLYLLPADSPRLQEGLGAAVQLAHWYAREHVLLCLIPALFIAGGIGVLVSQSAVLAYFGAEAKPWLSYGVASVSGALLAVCSCTILPLFAGIYKRGAGLGPAIAFLYSGPAINLLAIVLTARILGLDLGVARAGGAVAFSILIGLIMAWLYRHEERARGVLRVPPGPEGPLLWQLVLHFTALIGILVFATWAESQDGGSLWAAVFSWKWPLTAVFGLLLGLSLHRTLKIPGGRVLLTGLPVVLSALLFPQVPLLAFVAGVAGLSTLLAVQPGAPQDWLESTWGFAKQILPLLAAGVLVAGFLLGSPSGEAGVIPTAWVAAWVGGNTLEANLFAALAGALMYFATLTEVPIVQGLLQNGMGRGPALALLLAGPAVSLPSLLVIHSVLGTTKTLSYAGLVVIMATLCGWLFGLFIQT